MTSIALVWIACLMADPNDCREFEQRRQMEAYALHRCPHMALDVARAWQQRNPEWFIRAAACLPGNQRAS